jgi:hypothetical protein
MRRSEETSWSLTRPVGPSVVRKKYRIEKLPERTTVGETEEERVEVVSSAAVRARGTSEEKIRRPMQENSVRLKKPQRRYTDEPPPFEDCDDDIDEKQKSQSIFKDASPQQG